MPTTILRILKELREFLPPWQTLDDWTDIWLVARWPCKFDQRNEHDHARDQCEYHILDWDTSHNRQNHNPPNRVPNSNDRKRGCRHNMQLLREMPRQPTHGRASGRERVRQYR